MKNNRTPIHTIELEDIAFMYRGKEYYASTDDGTIIVVKFWYGADMDGRRGVLRYEIDDTRVHIDDVTVKDDNGKDMLNLEIREFGREALEEALYDYDYSRKL